MAKSTKALNKIHDAIFSGIHSNNLVYNTCWEDPRCDRELLKLNNHSTVVMITSAGCNALDYLLDNPMSIACIDVNPRQNALLELKQVMLQQTDHQLFFSFFGEGRHPQAGHIYREQLRQYLSKSARKFWDKKVEYFSRPAPKKSFYYRGTSGSIAWVFRKYLNIRPKTKMLVENLLASTHLDQQAKIYRQLKPKFLTYAIKWILERQIILAMVGVPRPQRDLINQSEGGFFGFVESCLDHIFTKIPMSENYFWMVYLQGYYTPTCCPNYLLPGNFYTLADRVSKIKRHSTTMSQFLKDNPGEYSHYILLDHQDWLAAHDLESLAEEWQLILKNSKKGTRILLRSAAREVDFFPDFVNRAVSWETVSTKVTHARDRVGTYGSVYLGVVI